MFWNEILLRISVAASHVWHCTAVGPEGPSWTLRRLGGPRLTTKGFSLGAAHYILFKSISLTAPITATHMSPVISLFVSHMSGCSGRWWWRETEERGGRQGWRDRCAFGEAKKTELPPHLGLCAQNVHFLNPGLVTILYLWFSGWHFLLQNHSFYFVRKERFKMFSIKSFILFLPVP